MVSYLQLFDALGASVVYDKQVTLDASGVIAGIRHYFHAVHLGSVPEKLVVKPAGPGLSAAFQEAANLFHVHFIVLLYRGGKNIAATQVSEASSNLRDQHVLFFVHEQFDEQQVYLRWIFPLMTNERSYIERWWTAARQRVLQAPPLVPENPTIVTSYVFLLGWTCIHEDKNVANWEHLVRRYVERTSLHRNPNEIIQLVRASKPDAIVTNSSGLKPAVKRGLLQLSATTQTRLGSWVDATFVENCTIPKIDWVTLGAVYHYEPLDIGYHEWRWIHENVGHIIDLLPFHIDSQFFDVRDNPQNTLRRHLVS